MIPKLSKIAIVIHICDGRRTYKNLWTINKYIDFTLVFTANTHDNKRCNFFWNRWNSLTCKDRRKYNDGTEPFCCRWLSSGIILGDATHVFDYRWLCKILDKMNGGGWFHLMFLQHFCRPGCIFHIHHDTERYYRRDDNISRRAQLINSKMEMPLWFMIWNCRGEENFVFPLNLTYKWPCPAMVVN